MFTVYDGKGEIVAGMLSFARLEKSISSVIVIKKCKSGLIQVCTGHTKNRKGKLYPVLVSVAPRYLRKIIV